MTRNHNNYFLQYLYFLFVYNSIQTSNSAEQYVYNITHQDVKARCKTLFINPITN